MGHVSLEHVAFSYTPEKKLIEDFNLDVKKGEMVAIVGPTGCGKTTLINLLMRFYDVNSGAIRIGGADIRDMKRETLRSAFGMVLQDTWLRSGTIRDNIRMGRPRQRMRRSFRQRRKHMRTASSAVCRKDTIR